MRTIAAAAAAALAIGICAAAHAQAASAATVHHETIVPARTADLPVPMLTTHPPSLLSAARPEQIEYTEMCEDFAAECIGSDARSRRAAAATATVMW
jgi:hypothetical protein